MSINSGLTTTGNVAKTARSQVARWNDRVKRHTVYTVCGTTQDGWGLYNVPPTQAEVQGYTALGRAVLGNPTWTPPADGEPLPDALTTCDAVVGRNADPDLFNWVPVSYPAVGPGMAASLENNWQPSNYSIAQSAKAGVDELIRLIKSTPGTFALVGMSQGSVVISQVLKALLPGGSLASRYKDCIAGIAFGNPCRAPGASFPGGTPASGGGIIGLPYPLDPYSSGLAGIKTPDWWWELCTEGDFFSSTPIDTAAGPLLTPAVQAVFHFGGSLDADVSAVSLMLGVLSLAPALAVFLISAFANAGVLGATEARKVFSTKEFRGLLSAQLSRKSANAYQALSQWIYEQIGTLDIVASLQAGAPVLSGGYAVNPHILYGVTSPPTLPTGLSGLDENSTYLDVGIAYLNARGAAVTPR